MRMAWGPVCLASKLKANFWLIIAKNFSLARCGALLQ
jgi:hypothetical protein